MIKARTTHLHKKESDWNTLRDFVPMAGELIIYDIDDINRTIRFKFGDGVTRLIELPFVASQSGSSPDMPSIINIDAGRIK